ncbi:MAG: tRNA (adenosine(37)-N6)-dimethylallyltransferase MiaA [Aquamicrobium sp.]|uniref:tRNA (adenosine(37)-N6)-dimethylallyltransferase MiaA n=1 Tax=Aquamicrobium sp. TaxID=1872579 RepID=UPI00349E7C0F|nr:tRNA (adenosine(37)-N6)-dimethylallyltransferase MiaA [Aquamicrobium sp.]
MGEPWDISGSAAGRRPLKGAILIAGPTASGKSALALKLARETGGVIVNADSMQVYAGLRVLTARPDAADEAEIPHLLYGHVDPAESYSTGRYLRDVPALAGDGAFAGRTAIFVGGTGLYFRALIQGLSEMPEVPEEIRQKWRAAAREEGAPALHRLLGARDPAAAAAIHEADAQRIVRALEVLEASGRPISHWQKAAGAPAVDADSARLLVIEPDRDELAARIARRFDAMLDEGALEEARAIGARGLDPALPAMKAIGVRELLVADRGEMPFEEAVERAKTATRRYAKRQMTWFRTQFGPEWRRIAMGEAVDLR